MSPRPSQIGFRLLVSLLALATLGGCCTRWPKRPQSYFSPYSLMPCDFSTSVACPVRLDDPCGGYRPTCWRNVPPCCPTVISPVASPYSETVEPMPETPRVAPPHVAPRDQSQVEFVPVPEPTTRRARPMVSPPVEEDAFLSPPVALPEVRPVEMPSPDFTLPLETRAMRRPVPTPIPAAPLPDPRPAVRPSSATEPVMAPVVAPVVEPEARFVARPVVEPMMSPPAGPSVGSPSAARSSIQLLTARDEGAPPSTLRVARAETKDLAGDDVSARDFGVDPGSRDESGLRNEGRRGDRSHEVRVLPPPAMRELPADESDEVTVLPKPPLPGDDPGVRVLPAPPTSPDTLLPASVTAAGPAARTSRVPEFLTGLFLY